MQETEFPATDVYAPLEQPLLLGADPVFLAALALLLLVVATGMYILGRWHAARSRSGSDDAPGQIHTAILAASRIAMAADSNDLRGRVQTLRDLVERPLGPVLVLNKGMSGALKDMDAALKGEIRDDPVHGSGHAYGAGGHGAGHGSGGHGSGGHGSGSHGAERHKTAHDDHHPPSPASGGGAAAASSTIAVIGHPIHIHTAPEPAPAPAHARPAHAAHGETRQMSHDEQTSALALSVRRFNDYWSKSDLRVRELRAARTALSRRPLADVVKVPDARVWDRR